MQTQKNRKQVIVLPSYFLLMTLQMISPRAEPRIIQTGEMPIGQTNRVDRIGTQTICQVPSIARHVVMTGIAVIAAAAGHMPYAIHCIQTLPLISW